MNKKRIKLIVFMIAVCLMTACGRMQCVNKRNSDRIAELLSDDSFVIDEPGTVIYGKCKQCQNGKNKERLHDK